MKRLLSLLLCAVLLFGMIPLVNAQADTETATVDTAENEVTVSGTNSVGNLLSEEIQQAQEKSQLEASEYTGGYAVIGLSFEGNIATVEYSSLEEANLIVALYTEDGMQLLTSGNAVVSAEETVAEVTIEGTMPQYFMASAYLVDIYDFSPLCPAYDTPMYTQEMQALLASTVEDYDPDKVLNLDDSNDTNFAVYTDSVVVIEGGNGINEVVSTDYDNDTYVIENADGQITSLTAGTIIAYPYAEGEVLIVKISTIFVDGTTATITGAELEIEEVFAYLKLETDGGMDDATVDESTCDEGVTYEGIVEETAPPTRAWEGGAEAKKSLSYRIEKEFQNENASVTVSGGVRLSIGAAISFYISQSRQFVEFKITPEVGFDFSISGKLTVKEILLSRIIIFPTIPGMIIDYKSSIILETDAAIVFKASLSMVLGFGYDCEAGFQNLCSKPTANADMSVEGKIFFGINNNVNVAFLDDNIASFGFSSKGGIQLTGELTGDNHEGKSAEKELEIHHCTKCLDLSFDYVQTLSAETVFFKFIKAEKEILSVSVHLFKYYISFDPIIGGSGFGSCPFRSFRITLKVLDEKGKPVIGASVQSNTGEDWGVTNSNGLLIKYLLPGTCLITASSGDQLGQKLFAVSEPGNVTVRFGVMASFDGTVSGGILGTVESEKFQDEGIYQSGTCGDNVFWILTNDGTLTIFGTGEMYNYTGSSDAPWYGFESLIKKVVIGNGVTSIGDAAFMNYDSLISVTIPDSVIRIGMSAFSSCSSLTSIHIPASVTTIVDNAFMRCVSLIGVWVDNENPAYCSDTRGVLFNKTKTTLIQAPGNITGSYTIPASVINISYTAFASCHSLTSVVIPDSVTNIDSGAFFDCTGITSIVIPSSVDSIGQYAFLLCTNLTSVTFKGDAPTFGGLPVFSGKKTAYYPAGNSTWTSAVMKDFGSNMTWIPYAPTKSATRDGTVMEVISIETAVQAEEDILAITETTASEKVQDNRPVRGVFGGEYNTEQMESYVLKMASFKNLVPGQEYLLLAMVNMESDSPLAMDNLLFVDQAPALEDGTLVFQYVQREGTPISYVMACGASNKDLHNAVITFPSMCSDTEVQAVNPTVVYNGETLQEGLDYAIVGTADFTESGTYTCYIRGIYNYTGLVPCTYTVLDKSMVTSWNLTMSEKISMNFYMDINESNKDSATVNITLAGETTGYQTSDAIIDETTGQYVFTVELAAAQMTESVTVAVVNDGETVSTKRYSIRQYADYVLDEANGYDDSIKAIVREMLNYGGTAQIYFDYNADNLANDGITDAATNEVPESTEAISVSGKVDGIRFYGASLVYRDRIAVRYYFTGDVTGCSFTANGNTYETVSKDGMYYVEIADILPQDLDQQITLTAEDSQGNLLTVSYSPMNYIVRMNEKGSDTLKALVKALYNYHLTAKVLQTQV